VGRYAARRVTCDALKDGFDKDKVWKAMRAFEEEMFTRAGEKAQETWDNLQMFVQMGAAEKVVDLFKAMMQGGPPGP